MAGAGDCLFCGIVARKIPATIVLETVKSVAFRDINPKAPVHVLVIPKEHIDNLMALEPRHADTLMDMHVTIQKVATQEGLAEKGFRVAVNNGKDAGQAVGHLHYHVLAGRKLSWPPG
jgi:histidine triad (HIT) family protein